MPRVSVVIPAYQAERVVAAAISSVRWQTYSECEVIVVDDGSTDATARIAASFGHPVRVVSQDNRGVASARNRGIAEATGDLVAFCDADDILLPRHIESLLALYDVHGGIVTANAWWLFPGGLHRGRTRHKGHFPRPREQRQAILEQNFVSTMSLFPRTLVGEIGAFAEDLRRAEDWDFWARAIYAGHIVHHQPKPHALYRWSDTSLTSDRDEMDGAAEAVLRRLARRDDLTTSETDYLRRRLSGPGPRRLGREGDTALRSRCYQEAARLYREAAALVPTETMLVRKARVLSLAPKVLGPLVRARQLRIERRVGFGEGHVR